MARPSIDPPSDVRRLSSSSTAASTIVVIAAAAFAKILRVATFSPRMSATECLSVTSEVPTWGSNTFCQLAIAEIISLGTPTNRAFIAVVPVAVPWPPPTAIRPLNWLSAWSSAMICSVRSIIVWMAYPLSPDPISSSSSAPPARATYSRRTSASIAGSPSTPGSMSGVSPPPFLNQILEVADLPPLVSSVPMIAMGLVTGIPSSLRSSPPFCPLAQLPYLP